MRKFFIKRDLIIIVLLLLTAAAGMLLRSFGGGDPNPGVYAEIRRNGELDRIVYLNENLVFRRRLCPQSYLKCATAASPSKARIAPTNYVSTWDASTHPAVLPPASRTILYCAYIPRMAAKLTPPSEILS
jgi:Uncharacterized protein conserved in bacteria